MNSVFSRRGLLLAACLVATPPLALAQKQYDSGASDSEIKLGMAMPLSGPVSGYAVAGKVIDGYFKMLNEKGGINGRQVRVLMLDDQYSPPKSVEVARKLVEQEEVLAVFGNLGTAPNLAIQRYMNAKKVPQLFVQSGADKLNDPKNFPWTVPFLPSATGEGRAIARAILSRNPNAKIAILAQNDDLGRDMTRGLKAGLGDKAKSMIVAEASYETTDPTVDSQVVTLQASGADTVLSFGTGRPVAQAIRKVYDLGWKPEHYVNFGAGSISQTFTPAGLDKSAGVMTMSVYKDPSQQRWVDDPEAKAYRELMQKYVPGENPSLGIGVSGYLVAQTMEHVLRQAGDKLTRENLLRLASNIQNLRVQMLLPGVTLGNSPDNLSVIDAFQPVRFDGKELQPVGEPVRMN